MCVLFMVLVVETKTLTLPCNKIFNGVFLLCGYGKRDQQAAHCHDFGWS